MGEREEESRFASMPMAMDKDSGCERMRARKTATARDQGWRRSRGRGGAVGRGEACAVKGIARVGLRPDGLGPV
jgi:hypothetical protein